MSNKMYLVIIAVLTTVGTMTAHAADQSEKGRNVDQSAFDKYAHEVESLSKTAGPENRAVIATMRIPSGMTIEQSWLRLIPLIDYSQTHNGLPQPRLLKRSAEEFGSIGDVAGRVALRDIDEQHKITRDQVGADPSDQFKIEDNTHIKLHYHFRRGAILPNAAAEIHDYVADTRTMSQSDAADLRKRLVSSNILLEPNEHFEMLAGGYENYLVEATIGSVTKQVSRSGKHAPDRIWSLIEYLEAHSTKQNIPGGNR
jgi:hypothetical protein